MNKINFTAGPAHLPPEVFEALANDVKDYQGKGYSIMEISHRTDTFMAIIEEAQSLVRKLMKLPSNYEILFLSGGATTQFAMIPYNLLPEDGVAGYLNTGTWSNKAIEAALKFGDVDECASSEDDGFRHIPKDYRIDPEWAYFHATSNNTIAGTQLHELPNTEAVPCVLDMSSDIFSTELKKVEKLGLIYAAAQKNLGPAGTTLVIVNKELLGKTNRPIPDIFNYEKHIAKKSVLNTPPVYAILGCLYMLRWIAQKKLKNIEKENRAKATLLYGELDNNPLFAPRIRAKEDRSLMNVTFDMKRTELESTFEVFAQNHNIMGIKGHRSVGGFRVSLYNSISLANVQTLVNLMRDFSWRFG